MTNPPGVVVVKSPYTVRETINKLQTFLLAHAATIYAHIDQQLELHNAGVDILPLEFILFGNPKAGGQIIKENAIAALGLPLKMIAWEDTEHNVWLAYDEASYIQQRFSLSNEVSVPLHLESLLNKALGL